MPTLPDPASLALAVQVAQMLVVRASGHLFDHQIRYPAWEPPAATLQSWLSDLGVGGVILLGGSAAELWVRTQQLQAWAKFPLLLAADIEEGVGQRFAGATWFPPPMALAAIAQQDLPTAIVLAQQMGTITAQEALAIGLNWVLAPVVDVNNNPANPVINVRAFGETPTIVGQLAAAFIQGAQAYPVLTTAKHFPGHGDTVIDSHLDLPVLPHSWERLVKVEWPPFVAAIAAGVDAVMSAHVQLPALDPHYPATLSKQALTMGLRHHLGFEGLVVTDALVMGAIANRYGVNEAPVRAVEAGADILLMPPDPAGAIRAICAAVAQGRISHARILASVERIWRAKQKVMALAPTIAPEDLPITLAQLASLRLADQILTASNRVRVKQPFIRAESPQQWRNLIVVDQALNCPFLNRHTPAIVLPNQWGYDRLHLVDASLGDPNLAGLESLPTLVQLFVRGNPFRGSAAPLPMVQGWLQVLCDRQQLRGLVIYGSPYVMDQLLPLLPPAIPCVFSYGQMPAAQAIALSALLGGGGS
ncbi:glycoside hydrolase family 3 N-terminal domain-containing protein [Trichothermofontia sp.]